MRILRPCLMLLLSLAALAAASAPAAAQTFHPEYKDGFLYVKIAQTRLLELNQTTYTEWIARGNNNLPHYLPELETVLAKYSVTAFGPATRLESKRLAPYYKVEFSDYGETRELKRALGALPFVELVEQRPLHKTFQTPDDYQQQLWHLPRIRARSAWAVSTGSPDIVVAIVDDAVLTTHEDLAPDIWVNPGEIPGNGRDDDNNGYVDDVSGWDASDNDNNPNPPARATNFSWTHGTHCAGIASAATNNGQGVASIGYNTKILPVKAKPSSDDGPFINNGYEGVEYAIAAGADVISLSWGGGRRANFAQELMNEAHERGIVVLAAAGNDGRNDEQFPAALDHVVAVGATRSDDRIAGFTNYGEWVDLMAPGVQIWSTVAGDNDNYAQQSGTSMSTPLVAGLVALMRSFNSEMNPDEVLECLRNSCVNIDSRNPARFEGLLGAGRIDAENALLCVEPIVHDKDASVSFIRSPSEINCAQQVIPSFDLYNAGAEQLRTLDIYYRYNDLDPEVLNWQGALDSAAALTIDLPLVVVSPGRNRLVVWTENPNGGADENTLNDTSFVEFRILPETQTLPFTEDFEEDGFTRQNWLVLNPDDDLTWEIADAPSTQADNKAARVHNFAYNANGMRDGLVTPPLDFSNYENIELSFKHSYRRVSAEFADSIIILVSNDCGQTFDRVFANGGGQGFATGTIIGNRDFSPSGSEDWCDNQWQDCFSVDLSDYAGQKVIVMIENYNAYGNNIYIDDINIDGDAAEAEPEARFAASRNEVCPGGSIAFANRSLNAGGATIAWEFEGGSPATSDEPYPVVVYQEPGRYPVKLTVTTENGVSESETEEYITVREAPVPQFLRQNPVVCAGSQIILNASGAVSYSWSPATGLNTTSGSTVIASPAQTTTYTVTTYDEFGCGGEATQTVAVSASPNAVEISAAKESFCKGESATLEAPDGLTEIEWRLNGAEVGGENRSILFQAVQTATVELYGLTPEGCYGHQTKTLEVIEVNLSLNTNEISYCTGRSARLVANGAENYTWTPAQGLDDPSAGTVQATPETATTYTVAGSTQDCSDEAQVTVTPIDFDVSFLPSAYTVGLNNGGQVQFTDNLSASALRLWNFGDGATSNLPNPTHRYDEVGEYTVTLQATDLPCSGAFDTTIVVVEETSRDEALYAANLSLYPNPAKSSVTILLKGETPGAAQAELFNLTGQLVQQTEIPRLGAGHSANISLANVPAGVYVLKIRKNGASIQQKLVVE